MKTKMKKAIALALCAALVLCSGTTAAFALGANNTSAAEAAMAETSAAQAGSTAAAAASKEETVYVLTDAEGKTQKIIVSDWLKNTDGADTLNDYSVLKNIEDVNGDTSCQVSADGRLAWDAQGGDICYQGSTEQELPIDMSVTYLLDGKRISPDALAGKSGKVTIRYAYSNKQYETVEIDGKNEKIYVPFVVLTGMLLDNDIFTNVEVSNGKLINDGSRTAVIGIAFPGMQENLALDSEKLRIPDYVEITADVTDFELGITATVATNEIFNGLDTRQLDSVEDLDASLSEIVDAMGQLMDGSSTLYDGLCTLLEKSGELVEGIDKLTDGAREVENGAAALDAGAGKLQSGATQLYGGLSALSSQNASLNAGAAQVFQTLLSTANTQLAAAGLSVPTLTIGNYAEVLNGVIASLDENAVYEQALAQVTAAVEEKRPEIQAQVTAAVQNEVTVQVSAAVEEQVRAQVQAAVYETVASQVIQAATGMDKESYDAAVAGGLVDEATQAAVESAITAQMETEEVQQRITSTVKSQMESSEVQGKISETVSAQMQSDEIKTLIAENTEQQVQKAISENMAGDTVQNTLAAASEGAKSVISLKTSLDSYNAFYLGLQTYTAGVAEATAGAATLKAGADELKNGTGTLSYGTSELYRGSQSLRNAAPALLDGITQLRDGAMQLSDGLKEFNERGVERLVAAVDGNLAGLLTRLRVTVEVSKNYRSYSGILDEMDGQVKFFYRTEPIDNRT